jgi:hypothetical protein
MLLHTVTGRLTGSSDTTQDGSFCLLGVLVESDSKAGWSAGLGL